MFCYLRVNVLVALSIDYTAAAKNLPAISVFMAGCPVTLPETLNVRRHRWQTSAEARRSTDGMDSNAARRVDPTVDSQRS